MWSWAYLHIKGLLLCYTHQRFHLFFFFFYLHNQMRCALYLLPFREIENILRKIDH